MDEKEKLLDELTLDYIKNANLDDYEKEEMAQSIKSNELKIQALSLFDEENDFSKTNIIITLQSDKKKVQAMKQYIKNPYYYYEIIKSLSSDEEKIHNLNLINMYDAQKILDSITVETDEHRLYIVSLLENECLAVRLIKEIEDEEKKKQALELLEIEECKKDVILTLNEERRITYLQKIKSLKMQDEILDSIADDNVKLEYLQNLKDKNLICRVLMSVKSDEKKLEELPKLNDEDKIAMVIASLKNDEKKLNFLEKITDAKNKILIEMSLQDREKLRKFFLKGKRTYSKIGLDEDLKIGIEIESEGPMSLQIQTLRKIGIRGWETKDDDTLKKGVEVTSSILTDNVEDVENIYLSCSMLEDCEQEANERCAGQIHIGANYLKSIKAYVNLLEIWGNAEEIIYKISNEKDMIPRMGIEVYAPAISPKLNEAIKNGVLDLESYENIDEFINAMQIVQGSRYCALNLLNINNGKNTIEFRVSNGTINPDTWVENARLFGRIVQISQKLAEIEKKSDLSKEDKKLLYLKELLKKETPEQQKLEILMELLFSEEEKNVYRERYISCCKLLEDIPDEKNPLKKMEFKQVDFNKREHTIDEFFDVAVKEGMRAVEEVETETIQGFMTEGKMQQDNDCR